MTAVHVIGPPIMISLEQIKKRRKAIVERYGSEELLRHKEAVGMITPDERIALQELDKLTYLEG